MKAFLRHILRSADSNKGQTAVIIITVAIVTAMIFTAFSMYDVFYNINIMEYDRVAQGADILVGENMAATEYFSRARVERLLALQDADEIESVNYFAKTGTILKTATDSKTILLEATDLDEYLSSHTLHYTDLFTADTKDPDVRFEEAGAYSPIIIGERFAEDTGLKAGDLVEVYLPTYQMYATMLVKCVVTNEGIFASQSDMNVLTDFTSVGNQGQVSAVYIDLTDSALYDKYVDLFKEHFPAVNVGEGNERSEVIGIVRNNTLLLSVGLIFIIATVILILFTSYLIVARNRMNEMVVFKSAGATPAQVAGIMLAEVTAYAVVGGAIGLVLGRLMMGLAVKLLLPTATNAMTFEFWKYLVSYLIAVAVSVCATLVPVISVSKKTVRQLTSDGIKLQKPVKPVMFIISTVAVIGIGSAYPFLSDIALAVVSLLLVGAIALWVYCAIGYVVKIVSKLVSKIAKGGPAQTATLGIKRNGALRTVTVLVAVALAFSFLIVEVVGVVKTAVVPFRSRYSADDVIVLAKSSSADTYEKIKGTALNVEGVDGAGYYNSCDYLFPDDEDEEWTIYGVDTEWTLVHCTLDLTDGTWERWQKTENPIVLSENMSLLFGKKIGDTITVSPNHADYITESHTFTVVGIDYTSSEWDEVAYCKFSHIARMKNGATYLVDVKEGADKGETFIDLRDAVESLESEFAYVLTYDEWAYADTKNLSGVSTLLDMLKIMVYLVAVVGVFNISTVTFYDRRSEFRLMRLAGMSESDFMRFSATEGVITGTVGGLLGLIAGYGINLLMPSLGAIIGKYSSLTVLPYKLFIITGVAVIGFIFIWYLIAFVNRKFRLGAINIRDLN